MGIGRYLKEVIMISINTGDTFVCGGDPMVYTMTVMPEGKAIVSWVRPDGKYESVDYDQAYLINKFMTSNWVLTQKKLTYEIY